MLLYTYIKLFALTFIQDSIIFKPNPKGIEQIQSPDHYGFEDASDKILTTNDGTEIHYWIKKPKENMPYVVFFHGNTGNLADVGKPQEGSNIDRHYRLNLLKTLEKYGYGFIAVSLHGYGKSAGRPSEENFNKDIEAVKKLIIENNYDVISLGESLGAFPALLLMQKMENDSHLRGVALIAPFTNLEEKVYETHPEFREVNVMKYIHYRLDNKKILSETNYRGKILLLHPANDKTTGPYHSELLYSAGKHNNLDIKLILLQNSEHITWNADIVTNYIWREISDNHAADIKH